MHGIEHRAMELVPSQPSASRMEHRVGNGNDVPVAEREPPGHGGVGVKDTTHRLTIQRPREIEKPSTLGVNRHVRPGHRLPQRRVGGEFGRILLRKPTGQDDPGSTVGQGAVPQGIDQSNGSAGGGEQFSVLGIPKRESRPTSHRDNGPPGNRLNRRSPRREPRPTLGQRDNRP